MTVKALVVARSSENFSTLYNDEGSSADCNVQFWKVKPPKGYLPCGDVCEASPSGWIYGSNPPRGQVIVLAPDGTSTDLANPTDFRLLWTDAGSGATLNGSVWEMIVPTGFVALGYCCTFSATGEPPKPQVSDYYCVNASLAGDGALGPQIWDDEGSGDKASIGIWQLVPKDAAPYVPLGTFYGTGGHDPTTVNAAVLVPGSVTFD